MHQIRYCPNPRCGLRFPAPENTPDGFACPQCAESTLLAQKAVTSTQVQTDFHNAPGPQVEVLLDNIRSAWNVGSMLRSADGAGIRHVHLCGISPTPDNPKTFKTALGAGEVVPWTYHPDGLRAARELKSRGLCLFALEGGSRAESIFQAVKRLDTRPIGLIVGNEVTGVDPAILEESEHVVSIPMAGFKRSLNVAIAFGIAVYLLRFSTCGKG